MLYPSDLCMLVYSDRFSGSYEGTWKIADLGISREMPDSASGLTANRCTEGFGAPEMSTQKYDGKVDIWALAITYEKHLVQVRTLNARILTHACPRNHRAFFPNPQRSTPKTTFKTGLTHTLTNGSGKH